MTPVANITCLKRGIVVPLVYCSLASVGEQSRTKCELPEAARSGVLKNQLILALSRGHFVPRFLFFSSLFVPSVPSKNN